jgi:hypothetical protein
MRGDRAVSDVIGYVLVFSLVSLTVAVVSVAGVSALEDARNNEQINNAERAFDVLADNMADIHNEGVPSRATEMSLAEAALSTQTTATINVSGWSGTGTNFTVVRESDVVVWEAQGGPPTRIVYAFGTVLRSQRDGGTVQRAGPFEFDTGRTILPIVHTRTRDTQRFSGGIARVRGAEGVTDIGYRGDATALSNLWVNVTTEHATTWSGYLDDRDGTTCTVRSAPGDHERVTCELAGRTELFVTVHPISIELER